MAVCYLLEEDIGGFYCKAAGVNVKYIEGADINVCMSEDHERCDIANALQQNNEQRITIRLKLSD